MYTYILSIDKFNKIYIHIYLSLCVCVCMKNRKIKKIYTPYGV